MARDALAAAGYAPENYELLAAWNERRGDTFVTGYRLRERGAESTFEVYSSGGQMLAPEERARLGVAKKNWAASAEALPERGVPAAGGAKAPMDAPSPPYALSYPNTAVQLTPPDLARLRQEDDLAEAGGGDSGSEKELTRIGVFLELPVPITVQDGKPSDGTWDALPDGGWRWSVSLFAPDAVGQRVAFSVLDLPPGATVVVYAPDGTAGVYGPFAGLPPSGEALWTPTCFGEVCAVACHVPAGGDLRQVNLAIGRTAYLYRSAKALLGAKAAGACNLDVTCYPGWEEVAKAVGGMGVIGATGVLFCTCTLLADTDGGTDIPFVITANHCVRGQTGTRGAETLEFYWLFQTPSCDGTPPSPVSVPRTTGGADYLAGMTGTGYVGGGNDFTLLRMRNDPPGGLGKMGWMTDPLPLGTEVACLHHPRGEFKRIAFGNLSNQNNIHSDLYYESTWHDGTTEPGSSGSPLFSAATQQLIGQLWGGTASCYLPDAPDYYGRFAVTYGVVAQYIDPFHYIGLTETQISVAESETLLTLTVSISTAPGAGGASVGYTVSSGTATAGEDFEAASGVAEFADGENTASIEVVLLPDTHTEEEEVFQVVLSNPVNGEIEDGADEAVVAIQDDDPDTDGDGLSDYDEENAVFGFESDPLLTDSDADALSDYEEVMGLFGYDTDPLLADTDNDGVPDRTELQFGTNPTDASDGQPLPAFSVPWYSSSD